jgi:periodic tryptophan protein 1
MTSMITAAQWVPRGFAAPFPKKYELDESEYERIAELAKLQLDDAEDDLKEAQDHEPGKDENGGDEDQEMEVDGGKKSEKVKFVTLC